MVRTFALAVVATLFAVPATAQVSSRVDSALFSFPGSFDHPPSAMSAGLALSDRWLGDEPFANPATPGAGRVIAGAALIHSSRQDLRAGNRNFDEQPVAFDVAGAAIGPGVLPIWIYVHQPVLRLDDFVFNRGTGTDPSVPPATIEGQAEMREFRAGLAASAGLLGVRWGAAVEWTRRDDRYWSSEQSGAPDQGERIVSFEGTGVGWALGALYESPDTAAGRWAVGAAVRALPKLDIQGEQTLDLLSGSSVTPISAEREAGWEGGISGRYWLSAEFTLTAGFGGRSEQGWEGLGLVSGSVTTWSLGGQFRGDPWILRLGFGQEQQSNVPETRAGTLGVGFGWDLDGVVLDVGLLHRSLERSGRPQSYDDRVIGSVRVDF